MDRKETVVNYYSAYNEDLRFSSRAGSVEFLTTVHYIDNYLNPGDRILEIGAASGRYSHYFARRGYEVDAIELVPHNIELFKENTKPGEKITIRQGDAVNLEGVPSDSYDVTLLLGPMYHLFTEEDELAALSEAIRVTKRGGIVFAAYLSNDAVVLYTGFMRGFLAEGKADHVLDESFKMIPTDESAFSFHRKEEIDSLMKGFDVERLHYVGADMLSEYFTDTVNAMGDETFDLYMKYHFAVCERPDVVGLSSHLLDIFRKKG
ncbi:MAG: class I SAM-dependent methyltransferase [Clostridia bacterium]|nr:class I SAM-dependent methyltransferase [Clostridia bacterium]